ncbi:MAG: hypothetical protein PVS3B1_18360 [Ktedonobacteraceae bacterium]
MGNFWFFRNIPNTPLGARWLMGIGCFFGIGLEALNGWAELRHVPAPLTTWQIYVAQGSASLLWGTALIITALARQRCEQQTIVFTQPSLWFGLLCFVILPDAAMLALQENHVLTPMTRLRRGVMDRIAGA